MTRIRASALVASLVIGAGAALVVATPAHAVTICEQYGTTTAGSYTIMNNRWGTSAEQCIDTTSNGFRITTQNGTGNTSGAPVSYPAIYLGCHYANCSPSSPLPRQISQIGSLPSSVSYTYVSGATYDAAYDIWLDPTAKRDGVNQTEIMIWFNRQGSIQPIGSAVGNMNVGGRDWQVWQGNNGGNDVVSYVAPSAINSWSFNVMDFVNDTISRGRATNSWYITSIQAGFEPWIGGAGLAVTQFSAQVNGGSNQTTTTTTTTTRAVTTTTTTRQGGTTTTTGGGTGTCSASVNASNTWQGGFQAAVSITGNVTGWTVTLNLPSGVTIQSLWGGQNSGTSGTVSVTNASYNGSSNREFGFVASGSPSGITASCAAR